MYRTADSRTIPPTLAVVCGNPLEMVEIALYSYYLVEAMGNMVVEMAQTVSEIKRLRLEAGLSQNKLARMADLDRSTVSSAETKGGVNELTVSKLTAALSKALGRPVHLP